MAIEIREDSLNSGSLQSGLGVPTHLAPIGTLFTDKNTGTVYINKNGSNLWSNISTSAATGGGSITSFSYSGTNNTFSIVESGVTYSAAIDSMSGLTVNNNNNYGFIHKSNNNLGIRTYVSEDDNESFLETFNPNDNTIKSLYNYAGFQYTQSGNTTSISYETPTQLNNIIVPNASGTLALSVNGVYANSAGTITIPNSLPLSGGTVSGATLFTGGLSANTISATTYLNLPIDVFTGGTVSGATLFTGGLSANTISATTYQNIPIPTLQQVTDQPSGNTTTNDIYSNSIYIRDEQTFPDPAEPFYTRLKAYDNVFRIYSDPYYGISTALLTVSDFGFGGRQGNLSIHFQYPIPLTNNLIFNLPDVSGTIPLTVNGQSANTSGNISLSNFSTLTVSGLTANTISATTYLNLPTSNFTGGTVSGATLFTGGLTATTISATTYLNLPTSNFTGGTVSGATLFTGGLSATTISATTYNNLPNTLYTGNGALSGNRVVNIGTNTLNFSSSTYPNTLTLSGGNIGIGTATPSYPFHILGKAVAIASNSDANGEAFTVLQNTATPNPGGAFYIKDNTNTNFLGGFSMAGNNLRFANYTASGNMLFWVGSSDRISLFGSTGNVGINTSTDAGFKFDVNGTARIVTSLDTPIVRGNTTSAATLTLQSTSNATKGKILFGTSAYDEVNNRLGIGTASASTTFHTYTTTANTNAVAETARFQITSTGTTAAGFGQSLTFYGKTSTLDNQLYASITPDFRFITSTSSWGGRLNFSVVNNGTTLTPLVIDGNIGGQVTISNNLAVTNIAAGGNIAAATQFLLGTNVATSITYKTTNAGGTITPKLLYYGGGAPAAGDVSVAYDTTNQLSFLAGNSANAYISRAAIGITGLVNTANSEGGALAFFTQGGGSAMTEKMRLSASGNLGIGISPVTSLQVNLNNTDYTNPSGTNSHFLMTNPSTTGQNVVASYINNVLVAKWRTDYVGNISWVAGSTGAHDFYTKGDYAVGNIQMRIFNGGNVQIATSPIGGATADAGYKLDVQGTGRFTGTLTTVGGTISSTILSNANQILAGSNTATAAVYRNTNTGGPTTAQFVSDRGTTSQGDRTLHYDGVLDGLVFGAYNSNVPARTIARAGIQITNLTNTANAETGDLIFLTQSGGTAMTEKMRIFGNGNVAIGTSTDTGNKLRVAGNLSVTGSTIANAFSGVSNTILGTRGSVVTSGSTATAFINVSGTNTIGGTGYTDFLQVINNWSGATNPNKWFRVNSIGGFEILNSAYSAQIFSLTDTGILSVGAGNLATTSNSDGVTNYLMFGYNNTQIYDDGNTHIHSRAANQSMWINTNGGQLNLLTQSPLSGGSIGSGIAIATGTLNGYVTINTGRTITTAAAYGYLTTAGAGTYPGGSQSVPISLYATNRIWGQEIDAFSDERMKDIQGNITLDEGLKLVNNLKPIKYTWKKGDDKGLKAGYSAQQVVKSGFNHLISIIPNEGLEETIDDDGFVSPKDTQFSMNYDQVVPYHGVVLKHLLDKIEQLEKEIKELKAK